MFRLAVSTVIVGVMLAAADHAFAVEFMTPGVRHGADLPGAAWGLAVLMLGGLGFVLHARRRRPPRLVGGLITRAQRQHGR